MYNWLMRTHSLIPNQSSPLTSVEVGRRFSRIYDHLYANAPVRTPSAIAHEVGKLLYAALYLEEKERIKPAFVVGKSELRGIAAHRTEICERIASAVRNSFTVMNREWNLYPNNEIIILSDFDIAFSIGQLSDVNFTDPSRDIIGDALEVFRSQWVKRQGGQYFTDQRVTHLAIRLLEFAPLEGDDFVDICAGTGGFLLAALHHIRSMEPESSEDEDEVRREWESAFGLLKGAEIDREVAKLANAALSARFGQGSTNIVACVNSLVAETFDDPQIPIKFSKHLCAASNPPFGTKITVKDPDILMHYALARQYRRGPDGKLKATGRLTSRAPDVLFLEQNIKILKPGQGRLALVTPYQILSGPQTLYIREWLLKQAQILAVVDLPAETFQPHTGTKTCLLVVRRRDKPLEEVDLSMDPQVFMAIPKWIGHDRRGNAVYGRLENGEATSEILSDMEAVGDAFRAFKAGEIALSQIHPDSFVVDPGDIRSDPELHLNARFHRPRASGASVNQLSIRIPNKSEWKVVKISDVVDRIFFPGRFKRNYVPSGENAVPFLGGSNISQMLITNHKWLRQEDPRLPDLRVKTGWVVVTRSGSTGIVSIVPPAWDGFAMSEHVIRIVPRREGFPCEYVFAFLRTKFAQEILDRGVFGSVIDEITPEFIGSIEMPIPSCESELNAIVDKIRTGEEAKQLAIDSLLTGVEALESRLGAFC